MTTLLGRLEALLRYVAAGFLALIVAALSGTRDVQEFVRDVPAHAEALLTVAVVVGLLLYTAHLPVVFTIQALYIRLLRSDWPSAWRNKSSFEAAREVNVQRWLRRASERRDVRVFQEQLTRWSSNNHFLYCSVYVTLGLPTYFAIVSDNGWTQTRTLVVALGGLLGLLVIVADHQNTRMELRACRLYPQPVVEPSGAA